MINKIFKIYGHLRPSTFNKLRTIKIIKDIFLAININLEKKNTLKLKKSSKKN